MHTKLVAVNYDNRNRVTNANSLVSLYPEIARQFHPILNGNLKLENCTFASNKMVYWLCPKELDHVWESTINSRTVVSRTMSGSNCPMCTNRKIVKSNCLSTSHPLLSLEFHKTKNGNLTTENLGRFSHKKVWWICSKNQNHEYKSGIYSRTKQNGTNCPICKESQGERKIVKFLQKNNIVFETQKRFNNCKNLRTLPFDFYIPNLNMCIEFHGELHYKSKEYFGGEPAFQKRIKNDLIKANFCKENNINLLVIKYTESVEEALAKSLML